MKSLVFILIILTSMDSHIIFDFTRNADIKNWTIVDDVVMGGRSSGTFSIDAEGFGVFKGTVSLENNGGFSSLRYRMNRARIERHDYIMIKLRGDGKSYQFRIKSNSGDYYSYISNFNTSGDWQEIEIPLKDMYPAFRGRKLDKPNFSKEYIEEIAFLIGNKKAESFELLIDRIYFK